MSQIHELNWMEMIGDLVYFFPSLDILPKRLEALKLHWLILARIGALSSSWSVFHMETDSEKINSSKFMF